VIGPTDHRVIDTRPHDPDVAGPAGRLRPWTVTPSPRRETDLQSLQARPFADLSDFVGDRDGYVFFNRFDNMIAVTNGIERTTHGRFQQRVRNRYPITASVGIGRATTPAGALGAASGVLQDAGSAQDPDRREVLAVDSSDWIVRPREGTYPANERFFLEHVPAFVAEADTSVADDWLATRREQLAAGTLAYVAHQYDLLARL